MSTPQEALREALASGCTGEVVVRRGEQVGHIYVSEGRIAWVHRSDCRVRLCEIVRRAGVTLDEEVTQAVIEEARSRRAHFADILVQWGYLDEARARECVRALIAEQLGPILSLHDAAALFVPRTRTRATRMSFALVEVTAPTLLVPVEAPEPEHRCPSPPDRADDASAGRAMGLEGASGALVLDRQTGEILGQAGEDVEEGIALSLLAALSALGAGAEDVIAVRGDTAFVACAMAPSSALVVGFALDRTNLALARRAMRRLIQEQSNATGGPDEEARALKPQSERTR